MPAPEIPDSRPYRHKNCGTVTVVNGTEFELLADPFSEMGRTMCSSCNDYFPITEYEWADTGETISDYCKRHSARATKLERFLCSRLVFLLTLFTGFNVGVFCGGLLFIDIHWFAKTLMLFTGVVFAVIFGSLKEFIITKFIFWRVYGVSDSRLLK